jgi:hypothetical protein
LGDWAAASGGGGGRLMAADLLIFIRMLIFYKGKLFIYLALAKPALPGQFDLLVSSQSKEKS